MMSERSRALAPRLLAVLMVVVVAEGAGRVAYRLAFGHSYDRGGIAALSADATYLPRASQNLAYLNNQVLHPYFGFAFAGSPKAAERHGFVRGYPPQDPAPPGTLSVLVTGGSVALQLSPWIERALRERLKRAGDRPEARTPLCRRVGWIQTAAAAHGPQLPSGMQISAAISIDWDFSS